MKSFTTAEFRKLFADLPQQVQEQTRTAYRQFKVDPSHPSLRLKKVHPELLIYSARISRNYRVVGQLEGDTVIWF
uniref:ParE-like toxin domain-containing protein n=1 Tax=Cyanothece sp. (strain PCC 7425 / ATCC 29141) TaxID=395961 RepID=B8HPY7_CYAP4